MLPGQSIELYSKQLAVITKLNKENKTEDTFYTIAPINEKKRYEFIEELKLNTNYDSVVYKMNDGAEATAIYHVKVLFYDYNVIMVFTQYPLADNNC